MKSEEEIKERIEMKKELVNKMQEYYNYVVTGEEKTILARIYKSIEREASELKWMLEEKD